MTTIKQNKDNCTFKKRGGGELKCSRVTKLLTVALVERAITASVPLDYVWFLWE